MPAGLDRPFVPGGMLPVVDVRLPIGEFSKMTYLSVKALRHYHDVGLLEPTAVDPATGYRFYGPEQVAAAQAIRRFRDLDMPIDHIRVVLHDPDPTARHRAILAHLEQMQLQLERTQQTVASLQALLQDNATPDRADGIAASIEHRSVTAVRALAIAEIVTCEGAIDWCVDAVHELQAVRAELGLEDAGPGSALYSDEFFESGAGLVTAFVAIADGTSPRPPGGRITTIEVPAATLAVLLHDGPVDDLDRAYGDLGTYVAARGLGAPGPVREAYLTDERTEVGWPITTG